VVDLTAARLKTALGQAVDVSGQVLVASPQSAILEEAERWKADLIVVGSRGLRHMASPGAGISLAGCRFTCEVFGGSCSVSWRD